MDKIWDRNPLKSEVIGRCGGDKKKRMATQNRQSPSLKKYKRCTNMNLKMIKICLRTKSTQLVMYFPRLALHIYNLVLTQTLFDVIGLRHMMVDSDGRFREP